MSSQSPPKEPERASKGKVKGARRVSNLSEEQRNKKRENDRIAQQNIRRRNKELIENLQREVERLSRLRSVEANLRLQRQKEDLEIEVQMLRKALYIQSRPSYPAPGCGQERLQRGPGHAAEYGNVPHPFGSPYLSASQPYDQWPSSVVPVPSSVTVPSVESSPGASGPGEDFTPPAYVHTSVPMIGPASVIGGNASPPNPDGSRSDYEDVGAVHPTSDGYSSHGVASGSPVYTHEPPWSSYSTGSYYAPAAPL